MQQRIKQDIVTVEKHARFVWEINHDGTVSQSENPEGSLSIIAIIGQGECPLGHSKKVERALLCEVGFWRSRPYKRGRYGAMRRKKFFCLSPIQYSLVGYLIWATLAEIAEETASKWKSRTFWLPTPNCYYKRSTGEHRVVTKHQEQPRGVRFSFDLRDEFLISDLHWAEFNLNHQIKGSLRGLANKIKMCLSSYPTDGRSPQQFCRLKRAQPVIEALGGSILPPHLTAEMFVRYLGIDHPHIEHLSDIALWDRKLSIAHKRAAKILPNVEGRIKDLQLRINHEKNGHLVIEIYPPLPVEVIPTPVPSLSPPPDFVDDDEGSEDEITFD